MFSFHTLIIVITLVAGLFMKPADRAAIISFTFLVLIFNLLGEYIPDQFGTFYYLGAAVVDLFIIYVLSEHIRPTRMTVRLAQAVLLYILVNAVGWVLFMLYINSQIYTILCSAMYVYILALTLIEGDFTRVGLDTMDRWYNGLRSNHLSGGSAMSLHEKETRN